MNRMPENYTAAVDAMRTCAETDECATSYQEVDSDAGRAAIASYARMAEDETLFRSIRKIRARAIRRLSELLTTCTPEELLQACDLHPPLRPLVDAELRRREAP